MISESAIYKMVADLLRFPRPVVCKHYICLNLLSMLEENGSSLDKNLVNAVVEGNDEVSLRLLSNNGGG